MALFLNHSARQEFESNENDDTAAPSSSLPTSKFTVEILRRRRQQLQQNLQDSEIDPDIKRSIALALEEKLKIIVQYN